MDELLLDRWQRLRIAPAAAGVAVLALFAPYHRHCLTLLTANVCGRASAPHGLLPGAHVWAAAPVVLGLLLTHVVPAMVQPGGVLPHAPQRRPLCPQLHTPRSLDRSPRAGQDA